MCILYHVEYCTVSNKKNEVLYCLNYYIKEGGGLHQLSFSFFHKYLENQKEKKKSKGVVLCISLSSGF